MKLHKRKCRHCRAWFTPDPRNAWHQVYCSGPDCRKASRTASQRKRRRKNPDYYHGPEHRQRVRDWRFRHPFYWRKKTSSPARAKDLFPPQAVASERVKGNVGIYHFSRCQRHFFQNVGHESLDTLKHYVKLHTSRS
ncbi:MAG: hypothetical protein RRC34_16935 [Lentisphaeria bacterium]|nr:hypothetical protein [Lentisphaeria bacterium]